MLYIRRRQYEQGLATLKRPGHCAPFCVFNGDGGDYTVKICCRLHRYPQGTKSPRSILREVHCVCPITNQQDIREISSTCSTQGHGRIHFSSVGLTAMVCGEKAEYLTYVLRPVPYGLVARFYPSCCPHRGPSSLLYIPHLPGAGIFPLISSSHITQSHFLTFTVCPDPSYLRDAD